MITEKKKRKKESESKRKSFLIPITHTIIFLKVERFKMSKKLIFRFCSFE